jgi:hypothetical protein
MVIHGPNEERKRFEADEIIAVRREEFRVLLGIYVGEAVCPRRGALQSERSAEEDTLTRPKPSCKGNASLSKRRAEHVRIKATPTYVSNSSAGD